MATKLTADYPTAVWDQFSTSRSDIMRNAAPDFNDWDALVAELVATQTELDTLKYLDHLNASGGALVVGTPIKTGGADTEAVRLQTRGNLTLTLAEWDAVGLSSTGLVANTLYYLSGTVGEITATKPATTGDHVVSIGVALSTTTLRIDPHYHGVSA